MTPAVIITITIVAGILLMQFMSGLLDNRQKLQMARVAAEERKAMLEQGLSVAEIERLFQLAPSLGQREISLRWAETLLTMAASKKNTEDIAALLEKFMLDPDRLDPKPILDNPNDPSSRRPSRTAMALARAMENMADEETSKEDAAAFLDILRQSPAGIAPNRDRFESAENAKPASKTNTKASWAEIA